MRDNNDLRKMVRIFELAMKNDKETLKTEYPEYAPFVDRMVSIIRLYNGDKDRSWEIGTCTENAINFARDTKGMHINRDYLTFIGDNRDHYWPIALECFVNPKYMVENKYNIFEMRFGKVLHLVMTTEDNNRLREELTDSSMILLYDILKKLKNEYQDLYMKYGTIIFTIIEYSYINDQSYSLLFNFLNSPDRYIDRLTNNGYFPPTEDGIYNGMIEQIDRERLFKEANELFQPIDSIVL